MPKPLAQWNPARDVWETDQGCLCGHSDVWSETFPSSGMWVGGMVYALPTSEPRMDGGECSSLPTPRATRGGSNTETVALLGTPRCADGMSHNLRDGVTNPRGRLEDQISQL